MNRIVLSALLALGFFSVSSIARAQQHLPAEKNTAAPAVLAVMFHADWCPGCKALEPQLAPIMREFQDKPIFFTRFDLTDEFTNSQSARYAKLLGLENFYAENNGSTGYLLLIDAHSKKVLGRLTKKNSPEEIKAAVSKALMDAAA